MNQVRKKLSETPLRDSRIIAPDLDKTEKVWRHQFMDVTLRTAGENLSAASFHHYRLRDKMEKSWQKLIDPEVLDSLRVEIEELRNRTSLSGEDSRESRARCRLNITD